MSSVDKPIPYWMDIRNEINEIPDYEEKMTLKITYLFGTSIDEIIRETSKDKTITGNDFYVASINDEDALLLEISTIRQGRNKRIIAIPLNPKYELWTQEILDYTEEISTNMIYRNVFRQLQNKIMTDYFNKFEWSSPMYDTKTEKDKTRVNVTHRILPLIREWELSLCHNFNEYDFKNYFGETFNPDYNVYFNKLLNKSNYYNVHDVSKAIELKYGIFNPSNIEKYFYKEYLEVIKMIKRKFIKRYDIEMMKINPNLSLAKTKGGKGGKDKHYILKSNAIHELKKKNSNEISDEIANLDVVDFKNGIVVECGKTSVRKMLDSFNGVYDEIKNVNQYWVLQLYDSDYMSSCYKFEKTEHYNNH